jgi:hypothetical protein
MLAYQYIGSFSLYVALLDKWLDFHTDLETAIPSTVLLLPFN